MLGEYLITDQTLIGYLTKLDVHIINSGQNLKDPTLEPKINLKIQRTGKDPAKKLTRVW
jgi:hypothetical protein